MREIAKAEKDDDDTGDDEKDAKGPIRAGRGSPSSHRFRGPLDHGDRHHWSEVQPPDHGEQHGAETSIVTGTSTWPTSAS